MARATTTASHGTRKVTTSLGKTETTNGKTKINKSWQNKDKKSWQNNKNKGDKPCDTCFTMSQDQKFFVPADCDENVFQIICTLVKAPNRQGKTIRQQYKRN